MRRHELDLVALVFGAAFVVIGLAYAFARWSWVDGDRGWLLGAFLIALGVAGVVSATTRNRRRVDAGPAQEHEVNGQPSLGVGADRLRP